MYAFEEMRAGSTLAIKVFGPPAIIDDLCDTLKTHEFVECATLPFSPRVMFKATVANKRPAAIKFHHLDGPLWQASVKHGNEYRLLSVNSVDGLCGSVERLLLVPGIAVRPVRLTKLGTTEISETTPKVTVTFNARYLNGYVIHALQLSKCDDAQFFELPISYGMNHVIAIDYELYDEGKFARLHYYLDDTISESALRAMKLHLQRFPLLKEYMYAKNDPAENAKWVMRTSITGRPHQIAFDPVLREPSEWLMTPLSHYANRSFGKDVSKTTIIYEVSSRQPSVKKSKPQLAFSFKTKYDGFLKSLLIYCTYYNFLLMEWKLHDFLYRIVIRSNEKEGTLQYLWILNEDACWRTGAPSSYILEIAVQFRGFLRAMLDELPDKPLGVLINPIQLKEEKLAPGTDALHALNVDQEFITRLDLSVRVEATNMLSSADKKAAKQTSLPKKHVAKPPMSPFGAAALFGSAAVPHIVSKIMTTCIPPDSIEDCETIVETPDPKDIDLVEDVDTAIASSRPLNEPLGNVSVPLVSGTTTVNEGTAKLELLAAPTENAAHINLDSNPAEPLAESHDHLESSRGHTEKIEIEAMDNVTPHASHSYKFLLQPRLDFSTCFVMNIQHSASAARTNEDSANFASRLVFYRSHCVISLILLENIYIVRPYRRIILYRNANFPNVLD